MNDGIISNNALSFEGREDRPYSSKAFGGLLKALAIPKLTIHIDSLHPEEGSKNFKLSGSAEVFNQHIKNVSLYVGYLHDDVFEFQFKATLPSLTLETLQEKNLLPRSRFTGPLLDDKYQDVQLVFDSEDERLYVACAESQKCIELFPKLRLKRLGFEFLRSFVRETVLLDMYADIEIGSTPVEVKIEIPLGGGVSPKYWSLTSRSAIPLDSGLSELTHFLLKTVGVEGNDVFPESLQEVGTFFLDDVQILLDLDDKSLKFVSFRIKSLYKLEIAGSLSISRVGMRVTVIPGTPSEVSLTLFGHVEVKETANLDIQVTLPPNLKEDDWNFFMSGGVKLEDLTKIDQLPVGHNVKDLELHPGFLKLKSLELKKFEVSGSPAKKTVSKIDFDLAVFVECELIHGFKLKDPHLVFTANDPFSKDKSLSGSISGVIVLGNITFFIKAEKLTDEWKFTGETEPQIHLSRLVKAFEGKYPSLPTIIQGDGKHELTLENLHLGFRTTTEDHHKSSTVTFHLELDFPISNVSDSQNARLLFDAHFTNESENKYSRKFEGELSIGLHKFGVKFSEDEKENFFVADYRYEKDKELKLKEVVANVSSELSKLIPNGFEITVKDAGFAFAKTDKDPRKFLFGMDLGLQCDFTCLPLVGRYFTGLDATKIGINNLKIVFASCPFVIKEVQKLNDLSSGFKLPDIANNSKDASGKNVTPDENTPVLKQGANVAAILNLGGSSRPLSFPASPAGQQSSSSPQAIPNATTADSAIWFNIQKAIGPVHFERIGVEFRDQRLWVLLSASLTAAGLTISLDGLSLGSRLDSIDLKPDLRGLGIDYHNDAVKIGGSFSKTPGTEGHSDEYSGAVTLKARGLTISALGNYTTIGEHPSLFIFGRLDYPIGGPPFFFVTGLTVGFGYQRKLVIPPIDEVAKFSLITASDSNPSFTEVLQKLSKDIPPTAGENFLAAGVMFTSFKVVQSTVLLFATFGKRFELNLLGLSKLRMPAALEKDAKVDPVAEVELAIKGTFVPDDGFLELRAQLTPTSYLFSKKCQITGGFAFLCWFKQKEGSTAQDGDFVLTLGGYHPDFHVPSNYPTVPRLGFNWEVTEALRLRGEVYFALTPAAVMAGGYLQGEWRSGKVVAWFKAGVDFLIAWKPYHYDAHAYIDIGAEVTFELFGTQRLSIDVGADLHIWGPEFTGEATVHLWIISFTIHFGNKKPSEKATIDWDEFQNSFLLKEKPKPEDVKGGVCSVVVSDGLVRKGDGSDLGVINAKHFCLTTDSRIPATVGECNGATLVFDKKLSKTFGVAPVGVGSVKSAKHSISLKRKEQPNDFKVLEHFQFNVLDKNFPAALWGQTPPQINGPQFINAISGFEIRSIKLKQGDETKPIGREKLVKKDPHPQHCSWASAPKAFNLVVRTEQQLKNDLSSIRDTMRGALLASLCIDSTDLDHSLTNPFLKQPQSEAA